MYFNTIIPCDTQNGTGVRVSLFCSGCTFACPNCFNKAAQNFTYGKPFTDSVLEEIKVHLKQDHIRGLSILGGEGLHPKNREVIKYICKWAKQWFPNKDIWLWTGYTLEEIQVEFPSILEYIDTLVDGKFVQELYDPDLQWRGSSNQRVLRKGEDFE